MNQGNIDYALARKILAAHEYVEHEIGNNAADTIYLYSHLDKLREESIWFKEDGDPPEYQHDYKGRLQKVTPIDLDLSGDWLPERGHPRKNYLGERDRIIASIEEYLNELTWKGANYWINAMDKFYNTHNLADMSMQQLTELSQKLKTASDIAISK